MLSLRSRLTLWYTLALFVVLCLFGTEVLWVHGRLGAQRLDRDLDDIVGTLANVLDAELAENDPPAFAAEEATAQVAAPASRAWAIGRQPRVRAAAVLDEDGDVLGAQWNGLKIERPLASAGTQRTLWTAQTPTGSWRVRSEPRVIAARRFVLVAAEPLRELTYERSEIEEAMAIGIPIALLLAAAGGSWLAALGLQPIARMARQAVRISAAGVEDLGESNRSDELGQLARAFNGLVARLRAALDAQRQFMADASHELRTPVSVIRSAADVSLSRDHRDEYQYRDTLAIVSSQAQRLGRLVGDMLVLARADAGGYPIRPIDLYLDETLSECCKAVEPLATEREVTIVSSAWPETPFRGDEELLRQALLNVLQNAIQHTPARGIVSIGMMQDPDSVSIRISDTGPGIAPEDRSRVFERFVQLDPSRRNDGTGLGLPIAKWIAEAHHGSLALESTGRDGSCFRFVLPVSTGQ
jgi:two-component system, OmpR family, sensor kinase